MADQPQDTEFLLDLVDHEYLIAFGQITVQWSSMEHIMECAIWQAAKIPMRLGKSMTSQTQMQGKIDVLGTLLSQFHPNLSPHFNKVAKYIRECLLGRRNLVTHGFWYTEFHTNDTHVMKTVAKGKLTSQGRTVDLDELIQLYTDIAEVTNWIRSLCKELPKLQRQSDEPNQPIPTIPNHQDCATRKKQALRPLADLLKEQADQSP